jgi:transcriptional regulator with XRE-family HTH domain
VKQTRLSKIPTKYRKEVQAELRVISRTIQERRKSLKMTQEELAEKLNIAPTTLQFIEQSRRYPSFPMFVYICNVLQIEIRLA